MVLLLVGCGANEANRRRVVAAAVGDDGILPGVAYKVETVNGVARIVAADAEVQA